MLNPALNILDQLTLPYLLRLKGYVAVITGAGFSIGRAIAFTFGSEGASVACISRTEADI